MMHRFNFLFLSLCFWASGIPGHADMPDPNAGYIGSALVRANDSDFLTVEYVAVNSPAAEAGIKKGDCISAINGIATHGMSSMEARHSIEGDIGGVVKLTIRRQGSAEEQISIVRRSTLDTYLPAAKGGDPRAESYVGDFYMLGPTSTRDLTSAAEWYRKSADQGYAPAQTTLGYLYAHGLGVSKDAETALAWYLKAAKQGDAIAERNLGVQYYRGEGIRRSSQDAFNWFYSAAQQDDPTAEEYLGLLYRNGRGVPRNEREAFDWYYRSAQNDNPYGAWGLANMYEKGLGVAPNIGEALKWYQKAQAALPQNEKLKQDFALISMKAFLETRDSTSLDLSLIMSTFGQRTWLLFLFATLVYLVGAVILLNFTLKAPEAPLGLSVAIGWVAFYMESQGVSVVAVFLFYKSLTAETVFTAMCLCGPLPVIVSTFGSNRDRIWKTSKSSWLTLLLYAASSCLAVFLIGLGYSKLYVLITHSSLPLQPMQILIIKAKHASAFLTYVTIALVLPIAEEIIFRSYLFDALKQRYSGTFAVIISALAFSLIHFQWLYFIPLFSGGLVLGWIRLKTESLRLPIFLHVINNGIALAFIT